MNKITKKRRFLALVLSLLMIITMTDSTSSLNTLVVSAEDNTSSVSETDQSLPPPESVPPESSDTSTIPESDPAPEGDPLETTYLETTYLEIPDNLETVPETVTEKPLIIEEKKLFNANECFRDGVYYVENGDQADIIENMYVGSAVAPQIAISIPVEEIPQGLVTRSYYADTSTNYNTTYWRETLTSAQQSAYDQLAARSYEFDNSTQNATAFVNSSKTYYKAFEITFSGAGASLTGEQAADVYWAFRRDNPQIFWASTTLLYAPAYLEVLVSSSYTNGSTRSARKAQMLNIISSWKNEVAGYNEYSQEYLIHDKICSKNVYTLNAVNAHDATGMFIDETAVCEGISKAFQLMMNALDIDCILVTGYMTSAGSAAGGHAWNQVGLDNNGITEWYNIDVTWGDQQTWICRDWFNTTNAQFYGSSDSSNHTAEDLPIKSCTATTYSFANHDANYGIDDPRTITINQPADGNITVKYGSTTINSGDTVAAGSTITITVTPNMPSYCPNLTISPEGGDAIQEAGVLGSNLTKTYTVNSNIALSATFDEYVALVGSTGYTTLQAAFNNATTNSIVYILNDIQYNGETMPSVPITIASKSSMEKFDFIFKSNMTLNSNVAFQDITPKYPKDSTYSISLGNNTLSIKTGILSDSDDTANDSSFPAIKCDDTQTGSVIINGSPAVNVYSIDSVNNLSLGGTTALTLTTSAGGINADNLSLSSTAVLNTPTFNTEKITSIAATNKINLIADSNAPASKPALYIFSTIAGTSNINLASTLSYTDSDTVIGLSNETYANRVIFSNGSNTYTLNKTGNTQHPQITGYSNIFMYAPVLQTECFKLTYGSATKYFSDWTNAVEYINKLNSIYNTYVITVPSTVSAASIPAISLPTKAKSFSVVNQSESCALDITVTGANITYPVILNKANLISNNTKLSNLTLIDGFVSSSSGTNTFTSLTLRTDSILKISDGVSTVIGTLVSNNSVNGNTISISTKTPDLSITGITRSDNKPIILDVVPTLDDHAVIIKNTGSTVLPTCFTFSEKLTDNSELGLIKDGAYIKATTPTINVTYSENGSNATLGNYLTWADMVTAINTANKPTIVYNIIINDNVTITTLPAKCSGIKVSSSGTAIAIPSSFTQTIPVTFENISVNSLVPTAVSTWKTNGQTLTLKNVNFNSHLSGTVAGTLSVEDSNINGNITTFKELKIKNSLISAGNITGITNLIFENSSNLDISGGKTVGIVNITTSSYNCNLLYNTTKASTLPNVTVSGTITGTNPVSIKKINNNVTSTFDSGTKLLIASNANTPANKFAIEGIGAVTYKIGTTVYAGVETIELYDNSTGTPTKLGTYALWNEAISYINTNGTATSSYILNFINDYTMETTYTSPAVTKCAEISLEGNNHTLRIPTAFSQTVNYKLNDLIVSGTVSTSVPTWRTNGKTLTISDSTFNANLTGTTAGILNASNATVNGNIATFKDINIKTTLDANGSVTGITNLIFDENIADTHALKIHSGKTINIVNVTTVNALCNIVYIIPAGAAVPNVTISGTVNGTNPLNILDSSNTRFEASTKLLTASNTKTTSDRFKITGDRAVTYKISTNVYAGIEALELYQVTQSGSEKIATYSLWTDIISYINTNGTSTSQYEVVLLDDYNLSGPLASPAKTKCQSLTFKSSGEKKSLKLTGITLNTTVMFDNIDLIGVSSTGVEIPLAINIAINGNLSFKNMTEEHIASISKIGTSLVSVNLENSTVTVKSAFKADNLVMISTTLKCIPTFACTNIDMSSNTNKLTLGNTATIGKITCGTDSTLSVTQGKTAAVSSIENGTLNVNVCDINGNIITPNDNTIILSTTNVTSEQIKLIGADSNTINTYRSSNTIKTISSQPVITLTNPDGANLGKFMTLADMNTEINRLNNKNAKYNVSFNSDIFVTGAMPFPLAGKYSEITYKPASAELQIRCTADLVLTGNISFDGINLTKVRSQTITDALPININTSAYTLTLLNTTTINSLTNITGSTNSQLVLSNSNVIVNGNISGITKLTYADNNDSTLTVYGNISVLNIITEGTNKYTLKYLDSKQFTITNAVTASSPLTLCPMVLENGSYSEIPESGYSALTVIDSAPKISTAAIKMNQTTSLVFYKNGSAIKMGDPVISVSNGTNSYLFARFNDAIDYINSDSGNTFTVTLKADVPSAGAIIMPNDNKNVTIVSDAGTRTLNFTGGITLSSANSKVKFSGVKLNNSVALGIPVIVTKVGAEVTFDNCDVVINTMSGAGTVNLNNANYTVNGAISGTLTLSLKKTDTFFKNTTSIKNLINSSGASEKSVIRKLNGKSFTATGTVQITQDNPIIFNVVNADGTTLSPLTAGTILLTAANGTGSQFKTDNTMKDSDVKWLITKVGTTIRTAGISAYAYETGNRQTDVAHQFASFNEAKEYIVGKTGTWTIELESNGTGAIMTDLPANLSTIICTGSSPVTLTTTLDIKLAADITINNVKLTATGKTISGNNFDITLENKAQITAGKTTSLDTLAINSSTVILTLESQIKSISINSGNIKCPSIVS